MENTELSEAKAVSNFRKSAFKWGAIGSAITVAYSLILYVIDINLLINSYAGTIGWIFLLTIVVLGVREFKKSQGGYISLSEALFTAFLIYTLSTFSNELFKYILYNFIDTNLPIVLKEKITVMQLEMFESIGSSEEMVNKYLDKMENLDMGSIKTIFMGFAIGSAFGFVVSFIIALIMKKKRPMFE